MPERAMAVVAISFAAGILVCAHFSFAAALLAAGALLLAYAAATRGMPSSAVLITAALFVLGAARYASSRQIAPDDISRCLDRVLAFDGLVASDPEALSDRIRFVLRADRIRTSKGWHEATGRLMVSIYPVSGWVMPEVDYGGRLRVQAVPYAPLEATNPGQFSWRKYLARHGIYACASIHRPDQIRALPGKDGHKIVGLALSAKRYLIHSIRRIHGPREASVVAGMVLGTYAYLPPEMMRSFSRTGTLHLLAASGYNCFVILFLATPLLRAMRIMPRYRHPISVALLVLYLLMVGAKPSLVRATIMAVLVLAAAPLRRSPNRRNLFFTAAFVVLMLDPADLFDVGFQLSFAGVWALICVSPTIERILQDSGLLSKAAGRFPKIGIRSTWRITGPIVATGVATVAVSLVTAPIVAQYFNYVSLVSIPANMAMALGVPLVFGDGVLSAALAPVPGAGHALGVCGTWLTSSMLGIVDYLGSLRWAAVSVASPGVPAILGYYLILFAVLRYVGPARDED